MARMGSTRNLNRPTAQQARERGAQDYRAAKNLQENPYKYPGWADRRLVKWWQDGWLTEARKG